MPMVSSYYNKIRLYRSFDTVDFRLYFGSVVINFDKISTCSVEMCVELKTSSTKRRTNEVFPTHPSPSSTTLKLYEFPADVTLIFTALFRADSIGRFIIIFVLN